MPEAMASQSSLTRSRNAMIAKMAMTTKTHMSEG